jgi:predicted nucleic acid-binding protein
VTARYFLDTTVILDHVNGCLPATLLLTRLFDEGAELLTSDVVVSEAVAVGDDAHRDVVTRLVSVLDYVATNSSAARAAGAARMAHGLSLAESLIVATAASVDATVVTRGRPALERHAASVLTY